ncbi:NAD-dependent epimerase/dehydratase family protein [Pseudoruegeria sp. HB172150]|uniref:NAD-dependent epimerase/dehydratase family protein n=1 Tax=Pseudoruegeria sp. HB172150 TaxID=2721164 RepID=UPI00155806D1|nr:NAD-dependent epimerase/dehydratase family protein [Pseudoruegeria sp. HB172150]
MPRALLLGGTGQIGMAVADRLDRAGWNVVLASRTPPPSQGPWRHAILDRDTSGTLADAIGDGADLLLDCIAYDADHAGQLLEVQVSVGHIAAISSASVYCDEQGRTLDEAADTGFPDLPVPIPEDHPTVAPGPATYSTRKVAMERRLLDGATGRVTILRPCAIHGPHSRHAREYWFLRRLQDGRTKIPLAFDGRSRFQTTSTAAIAEALLWALEPDRPQILNVTDADAPTVAEIGRAIMAATGLTAELVLLSDTSFPAKVGATPWSTPRPFVCASSAPNAGTYAETVPKALDWLAEATRNADWRKVLPQFAAYPRDHFDYAREDRLFASSNL